MDIPLVTTAPVRAPATIAPVAAVQVAPAAQIQAAATLLAQTTVDLSPLGRFLSVVTLFQKRLLELQANSPATSAASAQADSEEALAAVASSLVALSESANALQASLINGTSDDQSLATLFNQQFDAQTDGAGESDSAGLAAIGLTFTPVLGGDDVLNVDSAVLQTAFVADPAGTAALLARTAAAFGSLTGVAAEAGADPSVLFADEPAATGSAGLPAQASAPGLPESADPAPPLSSDTAFLQELLAETPRPALALSQAPPPAVAEANATFAAERAAEAAAETGFRRAPDNGATPLPPPLPDTASEAPAAAAAAASAAPRDATIDPDNPIAARQASEQAAAAQAARMLVNRGDAARLEARDANNRIADIITAERDANERIAGAIAAGRVAQDAALETQNIDAAAVTRAGDNATEQRRLDADGTQNRLERAMDARLPVPVDVDPALPRRERVAAALAQPTAPAEDAQGEAQAVAVQRSQPLPVNNAQQLARDPAIAAAIAAYNLSAGPFAALNGRPEIAAQRPRLVQAVDRVASVEAIETDAATSDSSRPFR